MGDRQAPNSMRGKTVFITGPARGIGEEAARQLSRRGANLALAGLEPERLKQLATELGPNAAWWEADVRNRGQVQAAVAAAVERFGGIDVTVANAGVYRMGTLLSADPAGVEETIDVNLLGAWRTVQASLAHVVERRGYVLVVASLAAFLHLPLMGAYAASKAGVAAMTNALRMELVGTGAGAGVAFFSVIDTDMTRNAYREPLIGKLRSLRTFLTPPPIPVEVAGRAIVRAIERRSRWVLEPKYALPAVLAPRFVQRLVELENRRGGYSQLIRREPPPD
ncbi:MAG: SDR family NAD(P)-dependent oxidoreductase [Actinomycetota bacterium]|nr:SDR family NAD(P)-dependent oxidoreductase [Actinomycetota bacterium]